MSSNKIRGNNVNLFLKLSLLLFTYIRKLKKCLNINTIHTYADFSIILPADHMLPLYQRQHRQYDKFLPVLANHLDPGDIIIDVGANCGDTLAGMIKANQYLKFVCIEPDNIFFDYLNKNISRIKSCYYNTSITAISALVGKNILSASLKGSKGSKHAIVGKSNGSIKSQTLDSILRNATVQNARLLKSDTDGFDYDVIESAESILNSFKPILYFECQIDQACHKTEYEKTIVNIQSKGYDNWVIFDNFGSIIMRTKEVQLIIQLMDYLWKQNQGLATRTIYYYDLLAYTDKDSSSIDKAIKDYS